MPSKKAPARKQRKPQRRDQAAVRRALVAFAVKEYRRKHVGISHVDLARAVKLRKASVLGHIRALVAAGSGTMTGPHEMHSVRLTRGGFQPAGKVRVFIFFPSKTVLDPPRRGITRDEFLRPFLRRMNVGESQLRLVPFHREVLARYRDKPDEFTVEETRDGGSILCLVRDPETDDPFFRLTFGAATGTDGKPLVVVHLYHLAATSPATQAHWLSYEAEGASTPGIAVEQKFIQRAREGQFAQYSDPMERLVAAVQAVNNASPTKLFHRTKNPYLGAPRSSSRKSFVDATKEAYKLVDPTSFKSASIAQLLVDHFAVPIERVKDDNGNLRKYPVVVSVLEAAVPSVKGLNDRLRALSDPRNESAHEVTDPTLRDDNNLKRFFHHCDEVAEVLEEFARVLTARCCTQVPPGSTAA